MEDVNDASKNAGSKMKFVFWCSNEQRQFRLAELDSLIHMLGFQVSVEMNETSLEELGCKIFQLSSSKGGVVGEKLVTAMGCTEPVDRRRSQSHP